jgi:hypothetical protein
MPSTWRLPLASRTFSASELERSCASVPGRPFCGSAKRTGNRLDVLEDGHELVADLVGQRAQAVGAAEGQTRLCRREPGFVRTGNNFQRRRADQAFLAQLDAGVMGHEAHVVGIDFNADRHRAVVAQADLGHRADAESGDAHGLSLGDVLRTVGNETVVDRLAQDALADEDGNYQGQRKQCRQEQKAARAAAHGRRIGVVVGQQGHESSAKWVRLRHSGSSGSS